MSSLKCLVASLLVALCSSNAALAQCDNCTSGSGDIRVVRIPSGGTPEEMFCTSASADFAIYLDNYNWSASSDWVIHIFDCATSVQLPSHSIGLISFVGTPETTPTLRVLVAAAGQAPELNVRTHLDEGAIDFSGISVANVDLRAKITASVAISGNLAQVATAPAGLEANAFGRVQVEGVDAGGQRLGGVIDAPVVAEGAGLSSGAAIGEVIAWSRVAAKIEAKEGNIGRVRVVGTPTGMPTPVGIQGDILAENGRIGSIFTTAPIDSGSETLLKITAGDGIGEIRTISGDPENSGQEPVSLADADINAAITGHKLMLDEPETFPYNAMNSDGVLHLLEVSGDLRGEVHAANLSSASDSGSPSGIFVHGICYALISIDYGVDFSNIIAETFAAPIHVGRTVQGAIVATGGATMPSDPPGFEDGTIPSIVIGDIEDEDMPQNALWYGSGGIRNYRDYYSRGRGLIGIYAVRQASTLGDGFDWFSAAPIDPDHSVAALDGCVRAKVKIGYANVSAITHMDYHDELGTNCTKYSPVVEAPSITTLVVQDLVSGTIWSGNPDADLAPELQYATILDISIGCVRRLGAIRAKDWSSFVVQKHMFGDIHVPEIGPGREIWIGGVLGDESRTVYSEGVLAGATCHCSVNPMSFCSECSANSYYSFYMPSPVGYRSPVNPGRLLGCVAADTTDTRGQIWVHENGGLQGQIILNGEGYSYQPTDYPQWTGVVQIGEIETDPPSIVSCPAIEIGPGSSDPWLSPYYDGLPIELGGGSVGAAPFALHGSSCIPANPAANEEPVPVIMDSVWYGRIPDPQSAVIDEIILEFYGPVVCIPGARPLSIEMYLDSTGDYSSAEDLFIITPGAHGARTIGINSALSPTDNGPSKAKYRIRPTASLLCDGVNGLVGVEYFTYYVAIASDCNDNEINDCTEINAADPSNDNDCRGGTLDDGDPIATPNNGRIDTCNDEPPLQCPECAADYDQNGGIDGSDLAAFFVDFEAGLPCADVDENGGIDGSDLAAFFALFEAGGCV